MAGEDIQYAEDVLEEVPEEAEETEETSPKVPQGGNGRGRFSKEELAQLREEELAQKIPGYGGLFHVPKQYLYESCRLPNDMAAFAFAVRDMQQAVLNIHGEGARTESAWDVLKYAYMGYTIGIEGKGRDDQITLHRFTTEEKEAAVRAGLYDEGEHK